MGFTVKTEDEVTAQKPVIIFGKDVMQIKCFRNSFITGICTGVAGGLLSFLCTSKTLVSTHVAFASIWVGVFAYWIPCRYKYESAFLAMETVQEEFKRNKEERRKQEENTS